MVIAAAQTKPRDGNIDANIDAHLRFIDLAAERGVQLLVFPEMSLTGYVREQAAQFSFKDQDPRLDVFKNMAVAHNMVIVAGAPININDQLHIGSFIFCSADTVAIYTKQFFLHQGEEVAFLPNANFDPIVQLGGETISFAICADITNPVHPQNAANNNATLYVASLFYTPGGMPEAYSQLSGYAQKYSMNILTANYVGTSYNMSAAGLSALWNNTGTLVGKMDADNEGLLIADNASGCWETTIVNIA